METNFIKSDLADSIYYADLFRIKEKVWMILGHGKSEAGRIASNKSQENDLGRDCISIIGKDHVLYGRYDPGALNTNIDQALFQLYKIDIIAYCLSPEETVKFFEDSNSNPAIVSIDPRTMARLSVSYPYPAYAAGSVFSNTELLWLSNPVRRAKKFAEMVEGITSVLFVVVPYMPSVELKADLYKSYAF